MEGGLPITTPQSLPPHAAPTNAVTSSTSQTSLSSQLSSEIGSSPPHTLPPSLRHSPQTMAASSEVDGPGTGPLLVSADPSPHTETGSQPPAVVQLPAVTEASNIHLQYLENLIRDSNEELRFAHLQSLATCVIR